MILAFLLCAVLGGCGSSTQSVEGGGATRSIGDQDERGFRVDGAMQLDAAATEGVGRAALVIGNANYPEAELLNPARDAKAIAAALHNVGFDVQLELDLDRKAFRRAVGDFVGRLKPGDIALVYYAGHGIEIGGTNYLLGVDFDANNEADARDDGYAVDTLLERLQERASPFNILILDACRNDPFSRSWSRGVGKGRGFAEMAAALGTYIAFSTAPGDTALDGKEGNSPFTAALIQRLAEPGLELEYVFRKVRADVVVATDGAQVPWSNSNVVNSFYFAVDDVDGLSTLRPPFECQLGRRMMRERTEDGIAMWCVQANGTRAGGFASWFANGQLASQGSYQDNQQHGVWTYWSNTGNKLAEGEVREGMLHGVWTEWADDGSVSMTCEYDLGAELSCAGANE